MFQKNMNSYLKKKEKISFNEIETQTKELMKENNFPVGKKDCLKNLSFVLTGVFSPVKLKDEYKEFILKHGGNVRNLVTKKTDYLFVGESPGPAKMKKAKELKIKRIDASIFYSLVKEKSKNIKEEPIKEKEIKELLIDKRKTEEEWTNKYAPKKSSEIIGNRQNVERLFIWLKNEKEKAVLISGQPGIGKTTAAHLVCKEMGYHICETNASVYRSKKDMEEKIKPLTRIGGKGIDKKVVLIMDEVDGMSSGDRGGIAELVSIIKTTKVPIICICNDRQSQSIKTLANNCLDIRFSKPDSRLVVSHIKNVLKQEEIDFDLNSVESLVTAQNSDLRSIFNILSFFSQTKVKLSYEKSKILSVQSKKNDQKNIFEITPRFFSNNLSIYEKINLYFFDPFTPMMVHQNYLHGQSVKNVKQISDISESISFSDIVDTMIHGKDSDWSVAPLHGLFSCAIPGTLAGNLFRKTEFSSWFGKNSKRNKNKNETNFLLNKSFIKTGLSIKTFRFDYLPAISYFTINLINKKKIEEAVKFLMFYSIEDFSRLMETLLSCEVKKIDSKRKSEFTKTYKRIKKSV